MSSAHQSAHAVSNTGCSDTLRMCTSCLCAYQRRLVRWCERTTVSAANVCQDAYGATLQKTFSRCMYAFCLQAMIALDQVPGWWQCDAGSKEMYPMDYYAKDGGSWNSTWHQKSARIKAKA